MGEGERVNLHPWFQRRVAPEYENLTQKVVYMTFAQSIEQTMTAEQKATVDSEMAVLKSERSPQPKTKILRRPSAY
jgi:hypothetical protein